MSTRFMIQRESERPSVSADSASFPLTRLFTVRIGNSDCDQNLICLVIGCEWAACFASIIDDGLGQLFHTAADGVYITVCACMQTQHKVQLDARDSGARVTFVPVVAPTQQVMLMPVARPMVAPQQPQQFYAPPMQPTPPQPPQPQVTYVASFTPPNAQSFDAPSKQPQQQPNPMYVAPAHVAAAGPMSPAAALSQWLADNGLAGAEAAVVAAGAGSVADLSFLGEADLAELNLPPPLRNALASAIARIPRTIPK